jgi:DNA repair exonuclease SbcCD ATPase subunit
MVKIKNLTIEKIRGIKNTLILPLNQKSILIYGENGSGKSSLVDALEWFLYDNIEHLANEEIGRRKGRDALRNLFIRDDENGFIEVEFNEPLLNSKKSIDSSLNTYHSNSSSDFDNYISTTKSENLILHYRDLISFIISSKTEKLKELQNIIGFSKVNDFRVLLKQNINRISRSIKANNYDTNKSNKQSKIVECLGQNAYSIDQLLSGVNTLIKPLKLNTKINNENDITLLLNELSVNNDPEIIERIGFYSRIGNSLSEVLSNFTLIQSNYTEYYTLYESMYKSPEMVKKLQLLALYKEGFSVLKNDIIRENTCPLCQQEKDKISLIRELQKRIEDLEQVEENKKQLDDQADILKTSISHNISIVTGLLKETAFKEEDLSYKKDIENIKTVFNTYLDEVKKDFFETRKNPNDITTNMDFIGKLIDKIKEKEDALKASQSSNIKFGIYNNLLQAYNAYKEFREIQNELDILSNQQNTFQALYNDFIQRQENALNNFLSKLSDRINYFYTVMNPNESIEDIHLVPLKKDDELLGITIEYKFYNTTQSPPIAYLSESHINCLGLAFFLTSVEVFNKKSEFFILDDIISSFDKSHRTRFAKLISNDFNNYQVFLLTHEDEFFEIFSSEVKSKNWMIKKIDWNKDTGAIINEKPIGKKSLINKKIKNQQIDGLGNDIRIFTEQVCKEIAYNIEAPVAFRYSPENEKRMSSELLSAIQGKISKKSPELCKAANIDNLLGRPLFLGNMSSHDNKFHESLQDLECIWEEINKFLDYFYCSKCSRYLSMKYYDSVKKIIRCKCGTLEFSWK